MRTCISMATTLMLGGIALSMEQSVPEKWIELNIGSYKIMTTRQTIEESGINYLLNLLKEDFAIDRNEKGQIRIDRSQDEGHIIDDFLRTHKLARWAKLETARN